jgi:two-component system LytT family sensor kinase
MLSFSTFTHKRKEFLAEIVFLFFICVLSPLAVGFQIFSKFSFTLSLVLINVLGLPAILLFYRFYLPYTIGRKRYFLFAILFPLYILIYELNGRLSSLAVIAMPFIPREYRDNLLSAHPGDFTKGYFNQTIGYTCLVLLSLTSLYVMKLLFRKQHDVYELETDKLKLELNQLKSQVQPHFFFNTLSNMYALSVQGSPKTPAMIADLSDIMRYVLYNSEQEKVPLQKEVDFIKSYIELENLRHNSKDIIEFSIQGDISHINIEPLIFLPLIENSFKHSLQKDMQSKWVKLVLAVDEDEIIFQASNPVYAPATGVIHTGGIGLKNVRKRLQLLYPQKHQLEIHNEKNIFTVTLAIAIQNKK